MSIAEVVAAEGDQPTSPPAEDRDKFGLFAEISRVGQQQPRSDARDTQSIECARIDRVEPRRSISRARMKPVSARCRQSPKGRPTHRTPSKAHSAMCRCRACVAAQTMSRQARIARPSCALPYQLHTSTNVDKGDMWLVFSNTGTAAPSSRLRPAASGRATTALYHRGGQGVVR